jgi:ketosteroid isomerase-like protein
MSQENVELLRTAGERGRRDPEAFFGIFDPDVDWSSNLVDAEATRGVDAVRQFFRKWMGAFEDIAFEWVELIDAGDEVVTISRWHGQGKASGAPVDTLLAQVWTFRDGKIVRCRDFASKAEALEAVGLRE